MTAVIHINGVIGTEANLLGVIRQFKSFDKATEVEVHIDSHGGDVDEGMSIYNYLRGLKLPITTKATRAYSIAASIFMAGDVRLLEEGSNRMMIHMPWGKVQGGSKTLDEASAQLKEIEREFTGFYSNYTNVDEGSIRRLLENETFLSASEAQELGLATGTYSKLKAVAFYTEEDNKIKEETIMNKAEKFIQAFADFIEGKKEEKIVPVALVLKDANGEDINFPDLDENAQPEVGSKVEGRDGEILMPDGSKILIEGGVVTEIVAAQEQEEEVAAEANAETTQEEGTAEVQEEVQAEADIDFEKMLQEFEEALMKKMSAQFEEKENTLKAEILALKKEVGSTIENEPTINTKTKSQSGNYLTEALRKKQSR